MIVIGPSLLTGIGNHAKKYRNLFLPDSNYFEIGSQLPETKHALIFMLPIQEHLDVRICENPREKSRLYDCL